MTRVALGLVASLVASFVAGSAAAQPDWLPPEVKNRGRTGAAADDLADPCASPLLAPLAPALRDSGLDETRGACLSQSIEARTRGLAAVDRPEFYGTLSGSLFVDLHYLLLPELEIAGGLRAVDYRFVQNAVITADEVGVGPAYLAAAAALRPRSLAGRTLRTTASLRFELPWTDSSYGETAVIAAKPEMAAALGLTPRLALHARVAALLWLVRPAGDVLTQRALVGSSDVVWAPLRALAAGLGVEAQSGWYGAGLDHLLVRGGLRVPLRCLMRLELAAAARVLGTERTDLAVELGFTRDL